MPLKSHFDPLVIHGLRIGNATSSRNTRMLISKRKPSPAPTAIWFKKLLENFEPSLELSSFKVHTFPISTNAAQLTIENNFARYSKFNSSLHPRADQCNNLWKYQLQVDSNFLVLMILIEKLLYQ